MSRTIEVETLQSWLTEGKPVTVVDVRPRDQRAEWQIPGSIHVDAYARLKAGDKHALGDLELPEGQPVVTVCAAGNTSKTAAEQLEKRGVEAYSLAGGMNAWSLVWNTAELTLPSGVSILQLRRTGKGCLSYVAASEGEALVIDPALEPGVYQRLERERGLRIVGVLETHLHADHLSRAHHLAQVLEVPRYLPAQARVTCPFVLLSDGDEVPFGGVTLKVIPTPGHTWESSSYLMDGAVFTGDTLFLDSVGRPDLEAAPEEVTQRAAALYSSLQKLLALPEDTLLLPGHASEPPDFSGTPWIALLHEVKANAKLLSLEREAFIAYLAHNAPAAPPNHQRIVALNEACELPPDTTELEAGANRCAVPS